jgi:hypothetical protein
MTDRSDDQMNDVEPVEEPIVERSRLDARPQGFAGRGQQTPGRSFVLS